MALLRVQRSSWRYGVNSTLNSMQQIIPKVVFATLQTTYMLVENPSSSTNNSKDITKLVDSIAMLKHLPNQLSQVCREQRKPAMKPDFSKLWSAKVPLRSQYLFVGCLAKNLWDAKEASTIRKSVGHSSRQSQHSLSHSAHYVKGPTSDFCMREIQQTLQKKKKRKMQRRNIGATTWNKKINLCHRIIYLLHWWPIIHSKIDSLHTITHIVTKNCFMASVDLRIGPVDLSPQTHSASCSSYSCTPGGRTRLLLLTHTGVNHLPNNLMTFIYKIRIMNSVMKANIIDTMAFLTNWVWGYILRNLLFSLLRCLSLILCKWQLNRSADQRKTHWFKNCLCHLTTTFPTIIREVESVTGKIVSSFPRVMLGPLYYRNLEKCIPWPQNRKRVILIPLCP